ncbi:hypothetical protein HDU98_008748 [Podochytrium sp. JEL0797]|nr:hypothetical protein HDU98_008748 [Podochytrium sp. JEL0797]
MALFSCLSTITLIPHLTTRKTKLELTTETGLGAAKNPLHLFSEALDFLNYAQAESERVGDMKNPLDLFSKALDVLEAMSELRQCAEGGGMGDNAPVSWVTISLAGTGIIATGAALYFIPRSRRNAKSKSAAKDIAAPDQATSSTTSTFSGFSFKDIAWENAVVLTVTPVIAVIGACVTPLESKTLAWSVAYYFFTGLGITAGYHRYWSHRSYDATRLWQYILFAAGTGAVEGSVKWWCRGHRVHHRFTDTEKDPYNAKRGFLWSHMGWMMVKQEKKATVDISDLTADPLIRFQHKFYLPLALFWGFAFPTLVAGYGWGDWTGGFVYAGVARLVFVHHATFCVNSLAHWLGDHSFDDKRTPKDHFLTAIVTLGEGYHNFHHEFPADYRNALKFYQYDPTKWTIWFASLIGLTYNLKMFPSNEIEKGRIMMQEKKIADAKKKLNYGVPLDQLPSLTFAEFKDEIARTGKMLLIISGVVYDVTGFTEDHPGGKGFLKASVGRDVTASFNGGVYDHANAARNLSSQMRYATIQGAVPVSEVATEE